MRLGLPYCTAKIYFNSVIPLSICVLPIPPNWSFCKMEVSMSILVLVLKKPAHSSQRDLVLGV